MVPARLGKLFEASRNIEGGVFEHLLSHSLDHLLGEEMELPALLVDRPGVLREYLVI